jgi:cellulose synthase/poly-beta-1,6-N-acetylglucosamine synthase-like glycosyltransferase
MLCRSAADINMKPPFLSVIIPARNEEAVISGLLTALSQQDLPKNRYEIIVVDDRSTDATANIAEGKQGLFEHLSLIRVNRLPEGLEGKQNALDAGIRAAQGDVIVQTDADCLPPTDFLSIYARAFEKEPSLDFAFGRTDILWQKGCLALIQSADLLLMFAIARLSAGLGFPLSCMGNNAAFRKIRYSQLGGYPALGPSRIEDYQLLTAFRKKGFRIRFLATPGALNISRPVTTWAGLLFQRLRWARGVLVFNPVMNALSVMALFMSLCGIASVIGLVASASPVWAWLLAAKIGFDALLYVSGCVCFGEIRKTIWFPVWEPYNFVSPTVYALLMGLLPKRRWR